MNAHMVEIGPLAAAVAVVGLATAGVPPVTYLMPDNYTASLDKPLMLRIESGAALAAQTVAWPAEKLQWFFIRADGTQENRDTVGPSAPGQSTVAVKLAQPGVTVIGLDTKPTVWQVSGADLTRFLTKNVAGAAANPDMRRLPAREKLRVRRIESATTMVRVPAGDVRDLHSAVAQSKTGQKAEIRPLFDPTMLTVGSDFPLTIYVAGSKKPGVKVRATSLAGGRTSTKPTDASGVTHFRITHPGVWLIEWHHAEPLEKDADADWVIYSATLTFEVKTEEAGK